MVKIVKDRDLIYDVHDYDLILVGTSIMNNLGNGFQYKVGLNFPNVYDAAKTATKYGDLNKLGKITVIDGTPAFALCYITKGRYRPDINPDALDYDALEHSLNLVKNNYGGLKMASTILGHSNFEGGGDKEKIIALFNSILGECDVTLYDYSQLDIKAEKQLSWAKVVRSVGTPEYEETKKQYFWEWGVGIYEPVPEGLDLRSIKKLLQERKNKQKAIASFKDNA